MINYNNCDGNDGIIAIIGGRVIDPEQGIDAIADVVAANGKIYGIFAPGKGIETAKSLEKAACGIDGCEGMADDSTDSTDSFAKAACCQVKVINASGMWVMPGFIDVHVHFREPGQEYKEDIRSGCEAAAAGGFSAVCTMPNTVPIADCVDVIEMMHRSEAAACGVKVLPAAAITKGQKGSDLTDMEALKDAGVCGFSEDGRSVADILVMRKAMLKAKSIGMPIFDHTEQHELTGGCMHLGHISEKLGLKGIPPEAEEMMTIRDILLAKETGCRLHLSHISTKGSLDLIRTAKTWGMELTAETAPHYFTLTDADVEVELGDGTGNQAESGIESDSDDAADNQAEIQSTSGKGHIVRTPSGELADTYKKMNPPLRGEEDRRAVIEAIMDGTLDAIATDHAPHASEEKMKEMSKAPFGVIGLETSFAVSKTKLVDEDYITPLRLVELMSRNPARILGFDGGTLARGKAADITIADPELSWTVGEEDFLSKSENTAFEGMKLKGKVTMTIIDGKIVYEYC